MGGKLMVDLNKCCMTCFPSPVLAEKARSVEKIDDNIRQLADRMIDIMLETKGVGLAGPQVGVNLQIFVISLDGTKENAKVYINPQIQPTGDVESIEEGCLSLPGIYAKVKRHMKCSVKALDLDGNEFSDQGQGLYARALQHEYDHLQGILIKDKFSRIQMISARRQLQKLLNEYEEKQQ